MITMPRIKLRPEEIAALQLHDEGRAYLEYNEKVGGEPIGLTVPFGYPKGVEELGGVIAVYQQCIKQKVTWIYGILALL